MTRVCKTKDRADPRFFIKIKISRASFSLSKQNTHASVTACRNVFKFTTPRTCDLIEISPGLSSPIILRLCWIYMQKLLSLSTFIFDLIGFLDKMWSTKDQRHYTRSFVTRFQWKRVINMVRFIFSWENLSTKKNMTYDSLMISWDT